MPREDLEFWYDNLGKHLSDAPINLSSKANVLTRLGKDDSKSIAIGKGKRIAPHRLGAKIPAFYMITPGRAIVVGKIALESTPEVTFIPIDGPIPVAGRQYIAHWLVHEAKAPFMVGVVTDAFPNDSFRISRHNALGVFCEADSNFSFNLDYVRSDIALIDHLPWRGLVAPAINIYNEFQVSESGSPRYLLLREKMNKLLAMTPTLRELLPKLHLRPLSGEYNLVSLYYSA